MSLENKRIAGYVERAIRRGRPYRWYQSIGKVFGFWLLVVAVPFLLNLPAPLVDLFLLLPAVALARHFLARKRAEAVIGYISQGVRLNRPLAGWLRTCGHGERGKVAIRLLVISELLERGQKLGAAVALGLPEIPAGDVNVITAGEAGGSLLSSLQRLGSRKSTWRIGRQLDQSYLFYLGLVLAATVIAVGGMNVFVVPLFVREFAKIHVVVVPPVLGPPWSKLGYGVAFFVVGLPLSCWAAAWVRATFSPNYRGIPTVRWLLDRFLYHTPLVRGVYQPGQWADVAGALAQGVQNRHEFTPILFGMAQGGMNGVIRRMLERWAKMMENGVGLAAAARATHLPEFLCAILEQPTGDALACGLRYAASCYEQTYRRRCEMVRGAMIPVLVLALGVLVLLVDFSFLKLYTDLILAFEHKGPY